MVAGKEASMFYSLANHARQDADRVAALWRTGPSARVLLESAYQRYKSGNDGVSRDMNVSLYNSLGFTNRRKQLQPWEPERSRAPAAAQEQSSGFRHCL